MAATTDSLHDSSRRAKHSNAHRGKHRGHAASDSFSRGFAALSELAYDGVQLSARATDLATGAVLLSVDDHVAMPTASVGKVLLLIEAAARIEHGEMGPLELVDRETTDAVSDSGVWQHLAVPSLPIADLAALVAASSDNLATNVLLRRVGLDSVTRRATDLGLKRTALLDIVRDHRGPDDAPQLSIGSAKELTWLFSGLAKGEIVDAATSKRVVGWLSLGHDLSMVSGSFGLDPLAHRTPDHGLLLVNKTGTGNGVRVEVGVLRGPRTGVAYAVATAFDDTALTTRLAVLEGMRAVGRDVLEYVH
jgi:beta-lactamase class A